MIWPYIALLSLIIFWSSLFILLTHWPRTPNKSISQHSASHKDAYIFFTIIQASVGFVLWLFVISWFVPHFHLSKLFLLVYSITAWLQIVVSFIPDKVHGKKSVIHLHMANCFALGMYVITLMLCLAPTIHGLSKVLFILVALYMTYSVYLLWSIKGKPQLLSKYLYLQVAYIVSFQSAFIFTTFFNK